MGTEAGAVMSRRTKVAATCTVCAGKIAPGSLTGGDVSITINLRASGRATISAPICTACGAIAADDPDQAMAVLRRAARGILGLDRR